MDLISLPACVNTDEEFHMLYTTTPFLDMYKPQPCSNKDIAISIMWLRKHKDAVMPFVCERLIIPVP